MRCIGGVFFFSFLRLLHCSGWIVFLVYFFFVRVFFLFLFGGIAGGAGRCWGLEEEEVTF